MGPTNLCNYCHSLFSVFSQSNRAGQFYGFGGKSELQPVSEPRSASGILETELSIIDPEKYLKSKYIRPITSGLNQKYPTFVNEQARKPRSYACSELCPLSDLLTGAGSRATGVAKK